MKGKASRMNGAQKGLWWDMSWNPVVGCTGACPYCYARKMAHRFHRDFAPHWVEKNFQKPFPKRPSRIFVNSMSDVAYWSPIWLSRVMHRIAEHPEHHFLVLSKNPEFIPYSWWATDGLLCGVSVTDQQSYNRLVSRIQPRNFLSIEPLLGPIKLWGIHRWIIVGSETGNRKGKVVPEVEWIEEINAFARGRGIPLFFKESLRRLWADANPEGADFPQEYPERGGVR